MNPHFKKYLLNITNASACKEQEVIQSLWSGYGKIARYQLKDSNLKTVVIKHIALGNLMDHPRGWNTDFSHQRKVKSYQVETYWYEHWSKRCTPDAKIPNFIGSYAQGHNQWIILEDLNLEYPLRKYQLNIKEVKACLKWLANFHARFLMQKPEGLWEVGTYWHLATRPDELEEMDHPILKSKAHLIDQILNQCKFQTIVHGDAKLANFCFSKNGKEIAAVDFQYVGGGCGMKDVAYFLGSCLSSEEGEQHQDELLDYYFGVLKKAVIASTLSIDFKDLESEWRKMYRYACTDFTRFMLGWMPTHQKINPYYLRLMNLVLKEIND